MTRVAVTVLISAVAVGSLLGIRAFLLHDLDPLGMKVLLTTILISGACIVALASTERWERPGGRAYAAAGIVGSVFGFLLLTVCVWWEGCGEHTGDAGWSLVFLGAAGAHGAAVSRASLPSRLAWIRLPSLICAALLASLGICALWDGLDRAVYLLPSIGVCAILAAATTLLVASVQRMTK